MGRNENVAIFQDTEKMCRENVRLRESIKQASENQKLIQVIHITRAMERKK